MQRLVATRAVFVQAPRWTPKRKEELLYRLKYADQVERAALMAEHALSEGEIQAMARDFARRGRKGLKARAQQDGRR